MSTAHRWATVDLAARVGVPTGELFEYKGVSVEADTMLECFFNKDGKWYYAGVYQSFRLPDITPQEWVQLPTEVRSILPT